jgi:hypothetical protein
MYLHRLNKSNVFCSEPPEIISDLKNQTVQLGSDIRFKCNASGNPTPIIRWYHNDTLIIGQNGIELVLANATKINEGEYKCVAENIVINTTSNEAFVDIKGNTISIGVGFPLALHLNRISEPNCTVWFFKSLTISGGSEQNTFDLFSLCKYI